MEIQAAVLVSKEKISIRTINSEKLLPGQVLVKILYSGICRSQLMEFMGLRGEDKWLPHLLGHEGSGIVLEVGAGVKKVKAGDEVILTWIKSDGMDAPGAIYNFNGTKINSGPVTTFSNYSIVSENRLVIKPKNLNFDIAVLYGCALQTGAGMVFNELKDRHIDNIVIMGLGGIGFSALLAAISKNIKNIIAVDISNQKLEMAKQYGANYIFHNDISNLKEKIFQITKLGADICIESAGSVLTIEKAFSFINPKKGELIFASHPPKNEKIKIDPHELISGKKIRGSWGGGSRPDVDIPLIFSNFTQSNINLEPLQGHFYDLSEIKNAFKDLNEGKIIRPIIKMQH